jgi:hypothetical protein
LIARYFEPLTLSARPFGGTKVCATRVSARLAAFGVSQVSFLIIFLLTFGKWKCCVALYTSDFNVWHDSLFSESKACGVMPSFVSERRFRVRSNLGICSERTSFKLASAPKSISGKEFTLRQGLLQTKTNWRNSLPSVVTAARQQVIQAAHRTAIDFHR